MLKELTAVLMIALAIGGVLVITNRVTEPVIRSNQISRDWAVAQEITGMDLASADLSWDRDMLNLCNGVHLVRGKSAGYGGQIHLLIGMRGADILGVRVTEHSETPGLGDFIDISNSPWILGFIDHERSMDTMSGATITSRSVNRAVARLSQLQPPACGA
jgi:electron transport complex protein RnfG